MKKALIVFWLVVLGVCIGVLVAASARVASEDIAACNEYLIQADSLYVEMVEYQDSLTTWLDEWQDRALASEWRRVDVIRDSVLALWRLP